MNKKTVIISVLLVIVIIFSLGFFETSVKKTETEGVEILDSENNLVTVSKNPQRVAVLFSSLCDVWLSAGGEIGITVGESVERGFCSEDVLLVDKSAGKTIDTELLIAYEPDLVICSSDIQGQREAAEILKSAGIPVLQVRLDSFEDYLKALEAFTKITGKAENYTLYGQELSKNIELIKEKAKDREEKKILFIRSGSSASSAKAKKAEDNFAAAILQELGCYNIADEAELLLDGLSIEEILKANPDHIFISVMGDESTGKAYMTKVMSAPSWQSLDAVKKGNVHFLPKELFHYKPCSKWDKAYEYIDNILGD